ncbi:MAG: toll/interleukin-1 receptor domain-containing protein [Firmicutes bacterium]|nr:toll/interleukin-1 receptor domain-containing protein [Bacillota bacterium]
MKIFISYSTGDLNFVKEIQHSIEHLVEVIYWDKNKEPGEEAWKWIFNQIDLADLVLVLITDKTVSRAMAVGNEIGHAKARSKKIIPLVSATVNSSELGCLSGITYQPIPSDNPASALKSIEKIIAEQKSKLESQQALVVLVVVGIFLVLLSKK